MLIRFLKNLVFYGKTPLKQFLRMKNLSMREIAHGLLGSTSLGCEILKGIEQELKYFVFHMPDKLPSYTLSSSY